MIFVDSGGWYALIVPSSPEHHQMRSWHQGNREPLITTDYVLDETLTLLRARGRNDRALAVGRDLLEGVLSAVHKVEAADIAAGWDVFSRFSDKGWSFTDCVSYAVMQRLGITTAASFDHHFRQFGTVTVVP
jgi:predicted nucleic acid-binding protein